MQEENDNLSRQLKAVLSDKFVPRASFDAQTPIDKTLGYLERVIAVGSVLPSSFHSLILSFILSFMACLPKGSDTYSPKCVSVRASVLAADIPTTMHICHNLGQTVTSKPKLTHIDIYGVCRGKHLVWGSTWFGEAHGLVKHLVHFGEALWGSTWFGEALDMYGLCRGKHWVCKRPWSCTTS